MGDNDNSKKKYSYSISQEEEEEEVELDEDNNNNKNENSIKNQSLLLDNDKNISKNIKNNNIINNKNQNNFYIDSKAINSIKNNNISNNNNKKYQDKQTQKSNQKLSPILINQKEENKIIKEYKEILKVDEEDKNKELLNKIKDLEEKLSSSNKIINNLNNNKDIVIQKLTKTNKKLQNSLETISKKLDEKLLNSNIFKKKNNNLRQKFGVSLSTNSKSMINNNYNNGLMSNLSDDIIIKNNNMHKELNNAVNMIRILTNDNKRLQNKVDELEKNKELEQQEKNIEKIKIDKELQEHKSCKEKMEQYKDKIRQLSDKNHFLLEKISSLKSKKQKSCIFQINNNNFKNNNSNNNDLIESDNEIDEDINNNNYKTKKKIFKKSNYNSISLDKGMTTSNKKDNIINIKKIGLDLVKAPKGSLPKINTNKNKTKYKLNYNNQNNNNNNNNFNNIFNIDEMQQLNKVFKNNEDLFNLITKKIEIMQKSKDSLNNKYKIEKKQYIERIYSMQQHIDYLNGKIRENEIKINILQSQLNENTIHKKQLIKKVKILSAGLENELGGNNIIDNINNKVDDKNNEEINDNKTSNIINNNNNNSKKNKINGIRRRSFINALNESNSISDNIVENLEIIKEQTNNNHNNSEFINEGDKILEENVSEASSKRKINNDDDNDRSFL